MPVSDLFVYYFWCSLNKFTAAFIMFKFEGDQSRKTFTHKVEYSKQIQISHIL